MRPSRFAPIVVAAAVLSAAATAAAQIPSAPAGQAGRILGQAAGIAVSRAPYGGAVTGAVASGATWAGGEAIYRFASEIRARDELELSYRLGAPDAVERVGPVTSKATANAGELDPCTLLTADEIKTALGRKDLSAAKPFREPDGISGCRFAASATGDVVIVVQPMGATKLEFEMLREIKQLKDAEKVAGVGDGAYYSDDEIDFLVGNRIVTLAVERTARTEAPQAVKAALTRLATRIADRLRSAG